MGALLSQRRIPCFLLGTIRTVMRFGPVGASGPAHNFRNETIGDAIDDAVRVQCYRRVGIEAS